jgi:hypothetical protein
MLFKLRFPTNQLAKAVPENNENCAGESTNPNHPLKLSKWRYGFKRVHPLRFDGGKAGAGKIGNPEISC